MTNLNEMAERIAAKEGGKVNLPIAQVKEVLKLALQELKYMQMSDVADLLKRIK